MASRRSATPPTPPTPPPTQSALASPSTTAQRSPSTPVAITDLGRPLLDVTAGWTSSPGDDALVRIHPATGHIAHSPLPPPPSCRRS